VSVIMPTVDLALEAVPPGETHIVEGNVWTPSVYNRLVITTYEGFVVGAITVNGDNNLANHNEVPAVAWGPEYPGTRLSLGTHDRRILGHLPAGTRLGLKVRNVSDVTRPFQAHFAALPR